MRRVCLQRRLLPCPCAYSGRDDDRSALVYGQAGVWAKLTEVKWRRCGWGWFSVKVRAKQNLRISTTRPWHSRLIQPSCITSLQNLAMGAQRISEPDSSRPRAAHAQWEVLHAGAGTGAERHQAAGRQPHVAALLLRQRRH